ncbi:hypothetical protein acdb102_02210 [Acidothermaceae bacterium B102]|nr:hypothetical protein acdb102_02210 [Acidothermaceae bacterium B102]
MPAYLDPDFTGTDLLSVRLPSSPAAPWLARQLLAQWCREWHLSAAACDDSMVVMSELVTEFVGLGAECVTIGATVHDTDLEVSVAGAVTASIGAQAASEDDVIVHRMDLVRGLADRVDVRLDHEGRTVVVAVPLRRAP